MSVHPLMTTRARALIAVIGLVAIAAGCGAILDIETPGDNAHIRITGTAASPIQLIRSNDFKQILNTQTGDISITIVNADTLDITLPYDQNYGLDGRLRFYMRLLNPDPAVAADVRVRIDIERVDPYDVQATLTDFPLEYTFIAN